MSIGEGIDAATQALIISLLLDDVQSHASSLQRSDCTSSPTPDEELVWSLQEQDLMAISSILEDRRVALQLDQALNSDAGLVQYLENRETFERQDRDAARAFEEGQPLPDDGLEVPEPPPDSPEPPESTVAVTEYEPSINESEDEENIPCTPGPSNARPNCVACGDRIIRGAAFLQAPCGDFYDAHCINDLFQAIANGDRSLFPARCCREEIPFDNAEPHLSPNVIESYREKAREFSVINQLYCPNSRCSKFLGPASDHEKGTAVCEDCETAVCTLCKREDHPAYVPCQTDTESAAVLALGETEHWQRCPGCHRLVELEIGCYHMTCLCRTQFCYLCSQVWKNCECRQWDEPRLLVAAEDQVRVQYNVAEGRPLNVVQQQAVRRRAEELRDNHECQHPRWRKRGGGARCDTCRCWLPLYILRCTSCQTLSCVRCQRNRL